MHPRIVAEGFEIAKEKALEVLEQVKVTKEMDRETLIDVAKTSLRTKVHTELADILTEVSVHASSSPFVCCAPGFKLLGLFLWRGADGRVDRACTLESDGPSGDLLLLYFRL